jgi:AcrR family transcriptional regulator
MNVRENRTNRRHQRRRDDIIEAAIAEIEEVGTASFTMASVADRADVTKPSLYYYFANKDDVLRAVTASVLTRYARGAIEALQGKTGADAAEAFVRYNIAMYRDRFELFRAVYLWPQVRNFADGEMVGEINAAMREVFDVFEAALTPTAPPSVVPRRFAFTVWTAVFGLLSSLSLFEGAGVGSRHAADDLIEETCRMVRVAATQ